MEQVKIDLYISDLLYRYDCVIVPDFGGFVGNYKSASLHTIQHKLKAPSKQISFNKNLRSNDGLLSSHIAKRKSIAYEEAMNLINSFVQQANTQLEQGDKLHIEKVGTLFLDPEKNIQFRPEEQNDFLLDSFGLSDFRVQPIKREGEQERLEKKIKESIPKIKELPVAKKKRYWPAAAVVLAFVGLSIFVNNQYDIIDSNHLNLSSVFTANKTAKYQSKTFSSDYSKLEAKEESQLEFTNAIEAFVHSDGTKTNLFVDNRSADLIAEEDNTAVASALDQTLSFHVIGGCFSQLANAEGLLNKLQAQGYSAKLLGDYKNLHPVSYGSFATKEEAISFLSKIKAEENKAAWLLVKSY